ncbi:LRR receptor-like serine/threonine-protein kinase EFR [Quercus robur]|uniref:LRR receptor-like serine/threonine-protein kinase EFR n=1 Tax=Quercus robur TaxID=38942 RepID=UPI0021623EFA|nr:LRR receptor-like serine/threonine-protein kinase EFR [Quercus robur]
MSPFTLMMLTKRRSILLLLAFLLVQPCILHLSHSSNNFTDQSALIAFKSEISSHPNDTIFSASNWSTTANFCEWFGVSCSRRRQRVTALNLSYVDLHGTISPHIGNLSFLVSLDLGNNSFSGSLPHEIGNLHRLRELRLSNNLLEGNNLSGTLPVDLCSHCPNLQGLYISDNKFSVDWRMISYQELCRGTNNFCESNLLGIGGFGTVYKGILSDGTTVAIKVLNLHLEDAFKSFDAECKVLRALRHRNLVKVISVCSSPQFKALVLQYMSNYSLEKWIYSHNYCLNLVQRVGIMVDIASALDYLHNGQLESVVHCDLKPSNILLDEDMVAHVGDFGIAKILAENKDATQTRTIGTIGYIAPEYGSEGRVSTKCDIYSYGIILLEMITRKKPTDEMFVGDLGMRQWIASLPDRMEVVDDGLLSIEAGRDVTVMQTILSSILELGLRCSEELPDERPEIKDVVAKVNKIKLALLGNRNRGV